MSTIDNSTSRSLFLPNKSRETSKSGNVSLKRNSEARKAEIESNSFGDSKVDIPEAIRDFSRIKKVADAAPEIDNTAKIARLKSQIEAGTYKVDPEALADKILEQEF
jgi:negative regulator of flagellin synthesis FlgM